MALTTDEIYRCSDPHCGAEMLVVVGSGEAGGDLVPRCCCGEEMYLVEAAPEDSRTANA
jgi:hypothetical protein